MAARNDITDKVIKTNPPTTAYRDGWDYVFAKKTAAEWLATEEFKGIQIIDEDGWRQPDGVKLEDKINYADFCHRLSMSTRRYPEKMLTT